MKQKHEFKNIVAETLLIPLYMRAKESRREHPILNDKAAEVRWTMVTMCPPEIESGRIVLQGKDRDLYLTVTSTKGAAIRLTTWPTKGEWYDADNSGYYEVGFTSSVSPGQQETFTVKISPDA